MAEKREISGSDFGNPVRINPTGCLYFILVFSIMTMSVATYGIWNEIRDANALKKQELNIQQQRHDLAKRQYTLDSLRYFAPMRTR